MIDLLEGKKLTVDLPAQPNSLVRLVDCMPRCLPEGHTTGDYAVVEAARVSYGAGTKKNSDDRTLIRYLLRHSHTTPTEMIECKWHMEMPIFIARQFIRHRTANVNEYSARYSVLEDHFYLPTVENMRLQSNTNKQGGTTAMDEAVAKQLLAEEEEHDRACYALYEKRIAAGMSRELARDVLPLNIYTKWYWKNDLWNTMNFLRLRMDSHAQLEIRELAGAMYEIMRPLFPHCLEAFDDYINMERTCKLSAPEIARVRLKQLEPVWKIEEGKDKGKPTREELEFQEKLKKLGLQ